MAQRTIPVALHKRMSLLSAVTSTGAGDAIFPPATSVSFQYAGITTATVKIQCTNDGTNWHDLDTVVANGVYTFTSPYYQIRANVTAYTAGTITVTMAW